MSEWIRVTDRLPEALVSVLVLRRSGDMTVACCLKRNPDINPPTEPAKWIIFIEHILDVVTEEDTRAYFFVDNVFAWMALPAPLKYRSLT
jgi:hypothetical protein